MNEADLKARLVEWARAYAGEQFQRLGYCSSERITEHAAPAAEASPADEIERIVRCMESAGRWRESRVLRAEYFMASLTESERLHRLSRIGVTIGRSAYYAYLTSARAFVLGAIVASESIRPAAAA